LYSWQKQAKEQNSIGSEEELKTLRKRLREVEQERDILKKALSIFSRKT
jgi:transposase-like protein